jgi:iron complex outermembrane recepter protein
MSYRKISHRLRVARSSVSALAMLAAGPLAAQAAADEDDQDDPIVVTGSRIPLEIVASPAPIAVVDEELVVENTGSISVGDELTDLPQFDATNNQAASAGFDSSSQVGLNLLDLRGLGSARTLVLVNGRRRVSSSQLSAQLDTNTVPRGLIERVDILTGGASAVYGADAVAGVVNFVLDDDLDGVRGFARAGISDEGDAANATANATFGRNFAGGRGNIAVDLEYGRTDALFHTDRPFAAVQTSFAPDFSANAPFTFRLVEDLRLIGTSTGGTIISPSLEVFRFAPDGTLRPADFGRGSVIPFGPIISEGGDGLNSIEDQTLLPRLEKMGANVLAHLDVGDAARIFFEGQVVELKARSTSQPTSSSFAFSLSNPFLGGQARSVLVNQILAPGATMFNISRVNRDFGTPQVDNERLTLSGTLGFEGRLSQSFDFEVFAQYGRTETESAFSNNVFQSRLQLAANAAVDGTGVLGAPGAIACAATLAAGSRSTGNSDVDQCVPVNLFGNGAVSAAARDYITFTSVAEGTIEQVVAGGYVSGDTGGFFNLPGGPLALVLGLEYREESTDFRPDAADLAGGTSRSGIQSIAGEFDVKEAYAELAAPILADVPGAELLELSGAVRVADYSLPGVGTNLSWGLGAVYAPFGALRFRGSYQRAVRAPNLAELFAPVTPTAFSIFDPCDATAIDDNPTRRANCEALGVPPGFVATTTGGIVAGTTGGNPDLDVERGRTWTVGAVLTPPFLPGFSASVDYYDIEIDDAIATSSASTLVRLCADSPQFPNRFCDQVDRDPATFDVSFIRQGTVNISRLTARGLDVDLRYSLPLGPGRIDLRALGTRVFERDNFLDPSDPDTATEVLRNVGFPRTRINFNAGYDAGAFGLDYTLRYFSSTIRAFAGSRLEEGDLPPDILFTGRTFIHDLSAHFDVMDDFRFLLGVDNLFEADLPPGVYGAGFGGANYDAVGRFFYAGVRFEL